MMVVLPCLGFEWWQAEGCWGSWGGRRSTASWLRNHGQSKIQHEHDHDANMVSQWFHQNHVQNSKANHPVWFGEVWSCQFGKPSIKRRASWSVKDPQRTQCVIFKKTRLCTTQAGLSHWKIYSCADKETAGCSCTSPKPQRKHWCQAQNRATALFFCQFLRHAMPNV